MHRCGSAVTAKIHPQWHFCLELPYDMETLAAPPSDWNMKRIQKYLRIDEQLGISRANFQMLPACKTVVNLKFCQEKQKGWYGLKRAGGNCWKAAILKYFGSSSSIWHGHKAKIFLLLLLLLLLWFVGIKFASWQVACKKRLLNLFFLVLTPLEDTESSILHTKLTMCSCSSNSWLQAAGISQSELIFPAVNLKHKKKKRCHCSWYPL